MCKQSECNERRNYGKRLQGRTGAFILLSQRDAPELLEGLSPGAMYHGHGGTCTAKSATCKGYQQTLLRHWIVLHEKSLGNSTAPTWSLWT